MNSKSRAFLLLVLFAIVNESSFAQTQYGKFVDPFIGTSGGGNVIVGPSCPYGMVKPGPDCDHRSNSGYSADMRKPVFGFSQIHVSGTGGGAKYGNVSVMPFNGGLDSIYRTSLRQDEKAALGYYSVNLKKWNINTEITAAHKIAFYRFSFTNSTDKAMAIDAGRFLNESTDLSDAEAQFLVGSEIEVVSDREIRGYNRVRGGWNGGGAYTVYFYVLLDQPFSDFTTWKGEKLFSKVKHQVDSGEKTGVLLNFNNSDRSIIQMKIGISFLSTGKAKQNIQEEVNGWDFDSVRHQTELQWEKLLSCIQVNDNAPEKYKKMFYTALYHSMLMPVVRSDENPLWKSDLPYYDDFYAIWDTYRTSHPLITLIDPQRQTDIVNSILNIYLHEGYMPDARSGNYNGRTQGGSNCDVLIADAYVKGLTGINYELALKAMLKNATFPPGGNEEKEGRGGLADYNKLGYVSLNYPRSGTRTVEYAFNDYCIATLAKGLGKNELMERFLKQSGNWQNLWRNIESSGAKGFIMPRDANGNWVDTLRCTVAGKNSLPYTPELVEGGQCMPWWSGFMYEASSWEYSLCVHHDIYGLIEKSGGTEAFKNRLDTFFKNGYYNVGNEPSFLSPTLYHWIGKPEQSSKTIHQIISNYFNESMTGIPGNDDSGAMSSWLAFHMLGLYPNAGHTYYLINTPFFSEISIKQANGKTFQVISKYLSSENRYIKTATLNNIPLDRAWIEHSEIVNGGILELEMTDKPSSWGNNHLPPKSF